jgi:hypothetical protein
MSIAVKRMTKIDRVDTRRSVRPAVDFEELFSTFRRSILELEEAAVARRSQDFRTDHDLSCYPLMDALHLKADRG